MLRIYLFSFCFLIVKFLSAQCYWQQSADYKMEVEFDAKKHQFTGIQNIKYTNHSPDTLRNLFYHLYYNAFQPGSEMDLRSRSITDPDGRVADRISKLSDDECGYQKIESLKMDGTKLSFLVEGSILEVTLMKPILPGQTVNLEMKFKAQVPLQIRRTGRHNKEGIDYSMSQWYPKLCEYDAMGWHSNPYIAREFYGIWGNFDVVITIDSKYIVAASGLLQNSNEIGYGYSDVVIENRPKKHSWHFIAERVHDFVWAADPEYKHTKLSAYDGTQLHFFYKENEKTKENWTALPSIMNEALKFMNERYGKYPYPTYSFIQGGDGGMEYPMATLITGERKLNSLVGVSVHEWMHSWYQMVLATNEALYPWMDEGFTSFGTDETMYHLISKGIIKGNVEELPLKETIDGFVAFAKSDVSEAIVTHADHYKTNMAYGVGSYTKGQLCLVQLEYIMGRSVFARALKRYFNEWQFKHPSAGDFFRIMEKESNMELDWFKEYWINTTHVIDYKIDKVEKDKLLLRRVGQIPMPVEVLVTLKNGKKELYYVPMVLTRTDKKPELKTDEYFKTPDWPWAQQTYELELNQKVNKISKIEIDPEYRTVDVNREDNLWQNED